MPDDIQNRGSGDFTGSIPAAYGNYDPMTPLASPNVMSTSQTKDTDLQSLYMEAARRGMFKQDTDMQAIGHELRRRGMVVDPTQGGLVQTEQPTDVTGKALFMKPNDVEKYLGVRYRFGGEGKQGIDCSAFTQQLYARNGVSGLPRTAQEQWSSNRGTKIGDLSQIQPGDQIFFQGSRLGAGQAGHTAYFAGWDTDKSGVKVPMMYAASSAAKSVVKQRLDDFLAKSGQTFLGAKRYPEFQKAGTVQQSVGSPTAAPTPDHIPLADPRRVQAQYDKFLSKPNDSTPYKVADRLSTAESSQRASDPQLNKMDPTTQAAILRKAHELAAARPQYAELGNVPTPPSAQNFTASLKPPTGPSYTEQIIEKAAQEAGLTPEQYKQGVKKYGIAAVEKGAAGRRAQAQYEQQFGGGLEAVPGMLDRPVNALIAGTPIEQAPSNPISAISERSQPGSSQALEEMQGFLPGLARGAAGFTNPSSLAIIRALKGVGAAGKVGQAVQLGAFGTQALQGAVQRAQAGDPWGALGELTAFAAPFALHGMVGKMVEHQGEPAKVVEVNQNGTLDLEKQNHTVHNVRVEDVQEPTPTPPVATETRPTPETAPQTTSVLSMSPKDIKADPERFQYKTLVGPKGTSGELRDVQAWDPNLAGVQLVWKDPSSGDTYVVNGHHRLDLAQRLNVPSVDVRYINAPNAETARSVGALANIAEGRGTAIDAAKFFRDTGMTAEDLAARGVSLRGKMAADGTALSRLPEQIWRQVYRQEIPVSRGVAIGSTGLNQGQQLALSQMIARMGAKGERLNDAEVSELARFVTGAGQTTESTSTLFGEEEMTRSNAVEKARLAAWLKSELSRDARLFGAVGKEKNAARLSEAGNEIKTSESQQIAERSRQVGELFDRLGYHSGPIAEALNDAAARLAGGANETGVKAYLKQRVSTAVQDLIAGREGAGVAGVPTNTATGITPASEDLFGQQVGEPTNATQTGQVTEGGQPEHIGVPQGANVPENRAEVRQGEGEQAGGGRGVVGGAEVQQAPQEVAPKPAENVMSTSQTAEGEVASPEDQIANEQLWGTVKKGDLLTEPGSSQRLRVQAKSTTRIKVVDENKPDAQPFTISRKEFREDYNLNVRPENEPTPPIAETPPPPAEAEPEMLTAPRNAVTEAERERRGVSPEVEKQATRQIGEMYERGRQEVENGMDVRTLAEAVANHPQNLSGEQTAALAYDRARLRSTQEDLEDRIVKADAAGDAPTADALRAQLSSVEGHLVNNEKALQRAGREWAMTGLARQLEIKQDYSASRMITKATVAKGSPLTEGERTQIQAMAKQIQEHASRIEALEKQNELLTQQQISKEAQTAQKRQNRALQQNLLMRQRQMLQRSISTKLSKLGAAPDPTVVPDLIKLARNYAATGINTLDGIVDAVWNDVQDHALRLGWTKPELKEALGNGIRNPASVKPMVDPELAVEKARLRNAQQNADQMLKRMTETTKQRNVRFATELLNVPRSIMETGNLHATMRQGLWLSATDPRLGARSLSASLQALMSGDRAERLNAMAVHSENEGLYRASGLHLAEKGLDKREEAFMSQMAERIPVLGKAVAASGRAYSVGLNVLRTGTFDRGVDLLKEAGKTPQSDPQAYQDLARFVDITSGRGRLGAFEQAAPQLTTILYSPRFMASRLQLIKDAATGFKGYDPVVRKMAIKSLAANSAFALSVMGMARASGATVGTDPNSPDFGKVLAGNTHIDVSAGLGPYLRAVARIIAMSYKRYGQGIPPKFGQMNAQDVATNFALSKASPPVSVPIELMRGKDIAGNAVSTPQQVQQNLQREGMQAVIESMAAERLSPIVAREIYEAMKEYGPVKGGAMAIPAFFGVTEQTYAPRVPHARATSGRTTKPGNFGIRGGTFRSPF